jgi:hypothetical protein
MRVLSGINVMRIGALVGMAAALAWGADVPGGPSPFYSIILYKVVFSASAGLIAAGALIRRRERLLAERLTSPRQPLAHATPPAGARLP